MQTSNSYVLLQNGQYGVNFRRLRNTEWPTKRNFYFRPKNKNSCPTTGTARQKSLGTPNPGIIFNQRWNSSTVYNVHSYADNIGQFPQSKVQGNFRSCYDSIFNLWRENFDV